MFIRLYRAENSGGVSGAAADAAAATPGAQGTDGQTADPNKSAASATGLPGGSAEGATPSQPKEPTTLEEAKAQLAERDAKLKDFETKLETQQKESKDRVKALKEKFATKINRTRAAKVMPDGAEAGDEIKPRGADGKYTPADLEEINTRAYRKALADQRASETKDAMDEYVTAITKELGLEEKAIQEADEAMVRYRRLYALLEGEKETDPVASPQEQVDMIEALIVGRNFETLVQRRVADAVAQRDAWWKNRVAGAGETEGSSLAQTTLNTDTGAKPPVDPRLAETAAAIERIRKAG